LLLHPTLFDPGRLPSPTENDDDDDEKDWEMTLNRDWHEVPGTAPPQKITTDFTDVLKERNSATPELLQLLNS
jgi:hypothetical protein